MRATSRFCKSRASVCLIFYFAVKRMWGQTYRMLIRGQTCAVIFQGQTCAVTCPLTAADTGTIRGRHDTHANPP